MTPSNKFHFFFYISSKLLTSNSFLTKYIVSGQVFHIKEKTVTKNDRFNTFKDAKKLNKSYHK